MSPPKSRSQPGAPSRPVKRKIGGDLQGEPIFCLIRPGDGFTRDIHQAAWRVRHGRRKTALQPNDNAEEHESGSGNGSHGNNGVRGVPVPCDYNSETQVSGSSDFGTQMGGRYG